MREFNKYLREQNQRTILIESKSSDVKKAFKIGFDQAHKNEKLPDNKRTKAPAQSTELKPILKRYSDAGDSLIPFLKAWNEGFHKANNEITNKELRKLGII